jgi:hypothetical protein
MKSLSIIAILFTLSIQSSMAQGSRTLRDECVRIRQGINSGQLTRPEALQLSRQTNQMRKQAIRYKRNDGVISPLERADLRRDNRRLNRQIFIQKHDRQRRRI